jgi:hypothetical protein
VSVAIASGTRNRFSTTATTSPIPSRSSVPTYRIEQFFETLANLAGADSDDAVMVGG